VSGALYRLLTGTQRLSRSQFEHADMQANMRAGALVVPAELRELGYDSSTTLGGAANSDIIAMAADSVVIRAIRASGIICKLGSYSLSPLGTIQPILGPLASTSGFAYLDSAGAVTATRAAVRTMRITIVAQSDRPISSGPSGDLAVQNDSMVTLVALRNTLR